MWSGLLSGAARVATGSGGELGAEQAEIQRLAISWRPPEPQDVVALAAERSQRYVARGDQLLEAVVEAIESIQADLDGDPGAARDLWDHSEGEYRPAAEPQATGWLQRRLRDKLTGERGIVFHREVEVVPAPGPQLGQRDDIHVTAVVQPANGAAEQLRTIVEVKGCWHPDVETALENQLVGEYMLQTATPYGVYVVVWFESDRWADTDRRREACARRDREAMLAALNEQARALELRHGILLRVAGLVVRLT